MTAFILNQLSLHDSHFSKSNLKCKLREPMSDDQTDEKLMLRYQNGENEAFDVLFQRYNAPLFRYIARQSRQMAIAEEIFQDVWMSLVRARQQYAHSDKNKFSTYLYRIAHNRIVDYFRNQNIRDNVFCELSEDSWDNTKAAVQYQPDVKLDTQKKIDRLLKIVAQLPDNQREAFLLKEESGLSVQEIADITGVNRETAKSRLRYAFARLRHGMAGLGNDEGEGVHDA